MGLLKPGDEEHNMRKLERVCIGVNFSPEAELAVATGQTLASSYGAHVDLLAVVEPPPLYARVITPVQSSLADTDRAMAEAREKLEAVRCRFGDQPVTCEVRAGTPFAELIAYCRERNADLLVMGARAYEGGLERLMLGRTVERVLRRSPVPVLAAKSVLPDRPQVVLAPTDFSPVSRPALEEATVLARRWGSRLIFVHVIEPLTQLYGWGADLVGSEVYLFEPEAIEPEWKALLGELDLTGVQWEERTEQGLAPAAICRVAASQKADLIVIATHGRTALAHVLLGSVAEAVLRGAPCSVLSVRPETMTFELP